MSDIAQLAAEHLLLRLRALNRALAAAVERQRLAAERLARPDAVPLCITHDQACRLLEDVEGLTRSQQPEPPSAPPPGCTDEEAADEAELVARAMAAGGRLPLVALTGALALERFEQDALLLCAAAELDRAYERIYAYLLDDLRRGAPCVELLATLDAPAPGERLRRLRRLGPLGGLRRHGVLVARGEAASELRQELRLGCGVLDYLLSGGADPRRLFTDPLAVALPEAPALPPGADPERVERLAAGLARGAVELAGVWGPRGSGHREAALALAAAAGLRLRRLPLDGAGRPPLDGGSAQTAERLRAALREAALLNAAVWIDCDPFDEADGATLGAVLCEVLTDSSVPALLCGRHPWRPAALLAARAYAELEVRAPGYGDRRELWSRALSEVSRGRREDLAARFRLGPVEVRAVARVAGTAAAVAGNGQPGPLEPQLEAACAAVTRTRSHRFASVIVPRRRPRDLVLPGELQAQVLEVATFFRAWPRVAEEWGYGRLAAGGGGVKALFTGDSGTGKTLAAEVIAGLLEVPLVKVDLARVVSKWVGETEKNLAAAFEEAEESHAVLFFDEADALFGRRGEIQHGIDRYANLEVSYLLQRLEEFGGLVILASNLKENIDAAFTRRFQVVLHFPRPGTEERRRIWELVVPPAAPRGADLDLDAVARLDMTGGSIAAAARNAALLAAGDGTAEIGMRDLVRGISRQYKREARLLHMNELGPLAGLLTESR